MNWSDDENTKNDNIMRQPSRDMPEQESEDENDYIQYIIHKTTNKEFNFINKKEDFKKPKQKQQKSKTLLTFDNKITKIERKFNPRLPPPAKYKKN
jgi:hypothetical protein